MKHDTVIINKITADEGMVLTNGETYSKEIYLGKYDKAENWVEITNEEYAEILKKQEEEISGGNNDHEIMSNKEETVTE